MTGTTTRSRRTTTNRCPSSIPRLDLLAPVIGLVGLFGAASFVGGDYALSLARLLVGACFLGAVSDAMLLGHWYLVQPGLGREPIRELVKAVAVALAVRARGLPDPGGDGVGAQRQRRRRLRRAHGLDVGRRLRHHDRAGDRDLVRARRSAPTRRSWRRPGCMYLAILTGFGMDLLPRALLG